MAITRYTHMASIARRRPADIGAGASIASRGIRQFSLLTWAAIASCSRVRMAGTLAAFAIAAAIVVATGAGLVALWLAYCVWMAARFLTLTLRVRSPRWLVTGAVR